MANIPTMFFWHRSIYIYIIWRFPKIGVPQTDDLIMENPTKIMIWGYVPVF